MFFVALAVEEDDDEDDDDEEVEEAEEWCFGLECVEEQVDGVRDCGDLDDALAIGEEVVFGIRTGADMSWSDNGQEWILTYSALWLDLLDGIVGDAVAAVSCVTVSGRIGFLV